MASDSSSGSDSDIVVELDGEKYYMTCQLCYGDRTWDEYAFMPCKSCTKYSLCAQCYHQYRDTGTLTCPHCCQDYDEAYINDLANNVDPKKGKRIIQLVKAKKAKRARKKAAQGPPDRPVFVPAAARAPAARAHSAQKPLTSRPTWKPFSDLQHVESHHLYLDSKAVLVYDARREWSEDMAKTVFPNGKKQKYRVRGAYRRPDQPDWFVMYFGNKSFDSVVHSLRAKNVSAKPLCLPICKDQLNHAKFQEEEKTREAANNRPGRKKKKKKKKPKNAPRECPFKTDRTRCDTYHGEINLMNVFDPNVCHENQFLTDRHNLLVSQGNEPNTVMIRFQRDPPSAQLVQPPPAQPPPRGVPPNRAMERGRGFGIRGRRGGRGGMAWGRPQEPDEVPKRLAQVDENEAADFPALPKLSDKRKEAEEENFNALSLDVSVESQSKLVEKYKINKARRSIEKLQKQAWLVDRPERANPPAPAQPAQPPRLPVQKRNQRAAALAPPGLGPPGLKPPGLVPPHPAPALEEKDAIQHQETAGGPMDSPPAPVPPPPIPHPPAPQMPPPPVGRPQQRQPSPPPPPPPPVVPDKDAKKARIEALRDRILNHFDPNTSTEEMANWPLEILDLFLAKLQERKSPENGEEEQKEAVPEKSPRRSGNFPVEFGYDDEPEDYVETDPGPSEPVEDSVWSAYQNSYSSFDPTTRGEQEIQNPTLATYYDADAELETDVDEVELETGDFPIDDFDQLNNIELQICYDLRILTMHQFANLGKKMKKKFIKELQRRNPDCRHSIRAHQLINTCKNILQRVKRDILRDRMGHTPAGDTPGFTNAWVGGTTRGGDLGRVSDASGFTRGSAVRTGRVAHRGTGGGIMDHDDENLKFLDDLVPKIIKRYQHFSISRFAQYFMRETGGVKWNQYWNGSNLVKLLERYSPRYCRIEVRGASDHWITDVDYRDDHYQQRASSAARPTNNLGYENFGPQMPTQSRFSRRSRKTKKRDQPPMPTTPPSSDEE